MADQGFDIQDELTLIHIQLNIPPASQRQNSTGKELVETWRIACVHIHVERAMERINIFDCISDSQQPMFNELTFCSQDNNTSLVMYSISSLK